MNSHRILLFAAVLIAASQGYAAVQQEPAPPSFEEMFEKIRQAAEEGNPAAQRMLGQSYLEGRGVAQDYQEAEKWIRKAAEKDDDGAQYSLGVMYLEGRGVPRDYKQAEKWLKKAAERGYTEAQYRLGQMYLEGEGVSRNYKNAEQCLRKAADLGHAGAQCSLGRMLLKGEGISQDYAQAMEWLGKAAKRGHAEAQYWLGTLYSEEASGFKNSVEAYKWLTLSIDAPSNRPTPWLQEASGLRDSLAEKMTPFQIEEARKQAQEWKSARAVNPKSIPGSVLSSKLIKRVQPVYPESAKRSRISGVVILAVTIDEESNVEEVGVTKGPPELRDAAVEAVRQWKYSPTLLDGKPVRVTATVTVNFMLGPMR